MTLSIQNISKSYGINFVLIIIAVLLLLVGCTAENEYAYTASASQFMHNGYRYYKNTDGLLAYTAPDGTENLVCYDPLCAHDSTECPAYLWLQPEIAVVSDKDSTPIVYYTDRVIDLETKKQISRLYRLDMKKGIRTVLVEHAEMINRFWLFANDIYLVIQCTTYDETGNAVGLGSNLYVMDADGKNLRMLTEGAYDVVNIIGITDTDGERTAYWVSYEDACLYASTADFQTTEKVMQGVALYGSFLHDGWLYYTQKSENRAGALIVDAHPQDKNQSSDGKATVRAEKQLHACYRINLTALDAEPELLYDGVNTPTSAFTPMYLVNGTLFIIPYKPVFVEAIAATMTGETGDAVVDSLGKHIQVDYIVSDSGSTLIALDLDSGELREIFTPGFDGQSIIGMQDAHLIVSGNVVDGERIREHLAANGVNSNSYVFGEIRMIQPEP
ncbi:MAG: hypothetical protein IJF49_03275 [Clostridia bacterium]|nr:hypothetical protein [Clostridia bacterium]